MTTIEETIITSTQRSFQERIPLKDVVQIHYQVSEYLFEHPEEKMQLIQIVLNQMKEIVTNLIQPFYSKGENINELK